MKDSITPKSHARHISPGDDSHTNFTPDKKAISVTPKSHARHITPAGHARKISRDDGS